VGEQGGAGKGEQLVVLGEPVEGKHPEEAGWRRERVENVCREQEKEEEMVAMVEMATG